MQNHPQLDIVLWSSDVFALADFLTAITGIDVLQRHPGYVAFEVGGMRLMLHADEAYRGHPWYDALRTEGAARGIGTELRFHVPDPESAYREALKRGAQGIAPPYDSGNGTECTVMGPDCYLISLWHE